MLYLDAFELGSVLLSVLTVIVQNLISMLYLDAFESGSVLLFTLYMPFQY
jgi:hypothetical protein